MISLFDYLLQYNNSDNIDNNINNNNNIVIDNLTNENEIRIHLPLLCYLIRYNNNNRNSFCIEIEKMFNSPSFNCNIYIILYYYNDYYINITLYMYI